MPSASRRDELLAELAGRYVWWDLRGTAAQRRSRVLAQIMDLGTYDDIRALEKVFSAGELVNVMRAAQPGWISTRSWEFWRGRLKLSADPAFPAKPPRRSFDAGDVRTPA